MIDGNGNPIQTGMTADELTALVRQGLTKSVNLKPAIAQKPVDSQIFVRLQSDLAKVVADLDQVTDDAKAVVAMAKQAYGEKKAGTAERGGKGLGLSVKANEILRNPETDKYSKATFALEQKAFKLEQVGTKSNKDQAKVLTKWKFGSKAGSGHVHITDGLGGLERQLAEINWRLGQDKGGGGGGRKRRPLINKDEPMLDTGFGYKGAPQMLKNAGKALVKGLLLVEVFKDAVGQEYEYAKEMRNIAYQTKGVTGATEVLQDNWTELNKVVAETGQDRTTFQKAFVSNVKKGIKSLDQSKKVTKSGLFAARQLGMEAEETADIFHTWHMQLGLSTGDMDAMSAALKNVASKTGVTGRNLTQAVRNSEKFMRNMRDTGRYSANAAEAMIGLTASAEKFGIAGEVGELQEILTGGINAFLAATPVMKAMTARASAAAGINVRDVWSGGVPSDPKKLKAFNQGLNQSISQLAGIPDLLNTDLSQINPILLEQINTRLQLVTGKGVGTWKKMLEANNENSKTYADRMADLEKKRTEGTISTQEAMNIASEQSNLTLNETSKIMAAYDNALAKTKTSTEGFSAASRTLSESQDSVKALLGLTDEALNALKPEEIFQRLSQERIKGLKELAKSSHVDLDIDFAQVQKDLQSGDNKLMRDAMAKVESGYKKVATEGATNVDPIQGAIQILTKVNETIRDISQKILLGIMGLLGVAGTVAAVLTLQLTNFIPTLIAGMAAIFGKKGQLMLAEGIAKGIGNIGGALGGGGPGGPGPSKLSKFMGLEPPGLSRKDRRHYRRTGGIAEAAVTMPDTNEIWSKVGLSSARAAKLEELRKKEHYKTLTTIEEKELKNLEGIYSKARAAESRARAKSSIDSIKTINAELAERARARRELQRALVPTTMTVKVGELFQTDIPRGLSELSKLGPELANVARQAAPGTNPFVAMASELKKLTTTAATPQERGHDWTVGDAKAQAALKKRAKQEQTVAKYEKEKLAPGQKLDLVTLQGQMKKEIENKTNAWLDSIGSTEGMEKRIDELAKKVKLRKASPEEFKEMKRLETIWASGVKVEDLLYKERAAVSRKMLDAKQKSLAISGKTLSAADAAQLAYLESIKMTAKEESILASLTQKHRQIEEQAVQAQYAHVKEALKGVTGPSPIPLGPGLGAKELEREKQRGIRTKGFDEEFIKARAPTAGYDEKIYETLRKKQQKLIPLQEEHAALAALGVRNAKEQRRLEDLQAKIDKGSLTARESIQLRKQTEAKTGYDPKVLSTLLKKQQTDKFSLTTEESKTLQQQLAAHKRMASLAIYDEKMYQHLLTKKKKGALTQEQQLQFEAQMAAKKRSLEQKELRMLERRAKGGGLVGKDADKFAQLQTAQQAREKAAQQESADLRVQQARQKKGGRSEFDIKHPGIEKAVLNTQIVGEDLSRSFAKIPFIGKQVAKFSEGLGDNIGKGLIKVGDIASKRGAQIAGFGAQLSSLSSLPVIGPAVGVLGQTVESLGGAASMAGPVISYLGPALGAVAGPAAVVTGAVLAVAAGIFAFTQALKAGEHAAYIFNKKQEELTLNQVWAAESAGYLTGVLNFLTLGIFRKSLGPTGAATQAIAKFFDKFSIFTWMIQAVIMPFKVVWGIMVGLWRFVKNTFSGLWEGILAILKGFEPLLEIFNDLGAAFGMSGAKAEGTISIIEAIASTLGALGTALGWLFKIIGKVIGAVIWLAASIIKYIVRPVISLVQTLVNAIIAPFQEWVPGLDAGLKIVGYAVRAVWDQFAGLGKVLWGLVTFDFGLIKEGFIQSVMALPKAFWDIIVALTKGIIGTILSIPKYFAMAFFKIPSLLLQAISGIFTSIGGMADNLGGVFGMIAQVILTPFKAIGKLIGAISSLFGGLYDIVVGLFSFDSAKIASGLNKIFTDLPNMVLSALKSIGVAAIKYIADIPMAILAGLKSVFIEFPRKIMAWITGGLESLAAGSFGFIFSPILDVWYSIKDAIDSIISPFEEVFTTLSNTFGEVKKMLTEAFAPFSEVLTSLFGASEGVGGFGKVLGFLGKTLKVIVGVLLFPLVIGLKVLAGIVKYFASVVKVGMSIISPIISGVAKAIGGFIKMISGVIQVIAGIFTFNWGTIKKGLGSIGSGFLQLIISIPKALWTALTSLGGLIWEGIKMAFKFTFVSLPGLLWEGIKMAFKFTFVSLPGLLWEGIKAAFKFTFATLPSLVMDGLKAVFVDFPNYLWEGFKEGLGKVWDWIKSWIPGGKGFTETAEESAKRVSTEGSSLVQGAGRVAGGTMDVITGGGEGRLAGLGKMAGGAWEGTKAVASGAWKGTKAVARALNPFNWFEEGASQITKTGLGVLHEGEAVIPAEVTKNMIATGGGPFKTEGGGPEFWDIGKTMFNSVFSGLSNFISSPMKTMGSILANNVKTISNVVSDPIKAVSKVANDPIGIFDNLKNIGGNIFKNLTGIELNKRKAPELLPETNFNYDKLMRLPGVVSPLAPTSITPTPIKTVHEEMRQLQAGTEPDVTRIESDELSELAKQAENLELLKDILNVLKEIKGEKSKPELSGRSGPGVSGAKHLHISPGPPNFHRLPVGGFNQTPNRQVANAGWH